MATETSSSNRRRRPASGRGSRNPGSSASGTEPRPSFRWDRASDVEISDLQPQARNPERVNVYVDGKYAFSLSAMLAVERHLKPGAVLSAAELQELFRRDEAGKATEAAVRLLTYRPRSEAELTRRLLQKGYDAEIISEAIERLRTLGYVDDEDFARFWVQNREQFKPMGSRRLRSELLQKGVSLEVAKQVLEEEMEGPEDEVAMRVARARLRTYRTDDYLVFRRRLGGYLARQGFDYETSARVVKQLWSELGEPPDGSEE